MAFVDLTASSSSSWDPDCDMPTKNRRDSTATSRKRRSGRTRGVAEINIDYYSSAHWEGRSTLDSIGRKRDAKTGGRDSDVSRQRPTMVMGNKGVMVMESELNDQYWDVPGLLDEYFDREQSERARVGEQGKPVPRDQIKVGGNDITEEDEKTPLEVTETRFRMVVNRSPGELKENSVDDSVPACKRSINYQPEVTHPSVSPTAASVSTAYTITTPQSDPSIDQDYEVLPATSEDRLRYCTNGIGRSPSAVSIARTAVKVKAKDIVTHPLGRWCCSIVHGGDGGAGEQVTPDIQLNQMVEEYAEVPVEEEELESESESWAQSSGSIHVGKDSPGLVKEEKGDSGDGNGKEITLPEHVDEIHDKLELVDSDPYLEVVLPGGEFSDPDSPVWM